MLSALRRKPAKYLILVRDTAFREDIAETMSVDTFSSSHKLVFNSRLRAVFPSSTSQRWCDGKLITLLPI